MKSTWTMQRHDIQRISVRCVWLEMERNTTGPRPFRPNTRVLNPNPHRAEDFHPDILLYEAVLLTGADGCDFTSMFCCTLTCTEILNSSSSCFYTSGLLTWVSVDAALKKHRDALPVHLLNLWLKHPWDTSMRIHTQEINLLNSESVQMPPNEMNANASRTHYDLPDSYEVWMNLIQQVCRSWSLHSWDKFITLHTWEILSPHTRVHVREVTRGLDKERKNYVKSQRQ